MKKQKKKYDPTGANIEIAKIQQETHRKLRAVEEKFWVKIIANFSVNVMERPKDYREDED